MALSVVYWKEERNLGDEFTHLWLEAKGVEHTMTDTWAEGNFVGVGSLLEQCSQRHLTIWGTGRMTDQRRNGLVDISGCTVLALRGRLSALGAYGARSNVEDRKGFALGDPGLLAPQVISPYEESTGLCIVPHWKDKERMSAKYPDATLIDVQSTEPLRELCMLGAADRVISSSLHGLVFADAYGIPRQWELFEDSEKEAFKFLDYATTVGSFEPGDWYKPADSTIRGIQTRVEEVFNIWHANNKG